MTNPKRQEFLAQERAELDAMVAKLARSPRLSDLLRYIGEKYLDGKSAEIREHSIATEVFGRPGTFDPGQDAIARVEAHRLRKKLKQYYETDCKDHPVKILIPTGTYVPVFQHESEIPEVPEAAVDNQYLDGPGTGDILMVPVNASQLPLGLRLTRRTDHRLLYAGLLAGLSLIIVVAVASVRLHASADPRNQPQTDGRGELSNASFVSPTTASGGAVRLLAGATAQRHVDPSGAVWEPDNYFDRGGPWHGSQQFTAGTNDQFLFQAVRTGEFAYHIPLKPGVYELHLYFVEPRYGPGLGGGELSRTFDVSINDHVVLQQFDIEADAMGPNIADERVFKDIHPGQDGKLHISFAGVTGKPLLSAIEILPGIAGKQLPIRMTAQPSVYIDHSGQVWSPDNYFLSGQTSLREPLVTGAPDPGLFTMERFGHFSYAIPVDLRSRYTVVLYFAEGYFGAEASGRGGIGSRVFNVMCNGLSLLEDFDIFKEAGTRHALIKTFHHLKPSPQGKLNLLFEPVANYANVSAIEVLDESH